MSVQPYLFFEGRCEEALAFYRAAAARTTDAEVRKLLGDLVSAGIETDEAEIRAAMEAKQVDARRQLMGEA